MAIDNPLMRIAAEVGSDLYSGAATYSTADGTLKKDTRAIIIRADQAAMITAISLNINGTATVQTGLNLVGADLLAGDLFTFPYEISSITITGGSFIGYRG
jgi:hypothetical protein